MLALKNLFTWKAYSLSELKKNVCIHDYNLTVGINHRLRIQLWYVQFDKMLVFLITENGINYIHVL